ncbi:MAG: hypothetical protein ACRDRT_10545, partial [Pseudonocardiaceae bacterium]
MIERSHDVVIVGAGPAVLCAATELRDVGITDFVVFDREVISSVFDDATDTWAVTSHSGETCRGRVIV